MNVTRYGLGWRFSMSSFPHETRDIVPKDTGEFVRYSDYQILEDKVRELESQFEKPKSWVRPGGA